jgi:hypothetical protein
VTAAIRKLEDRDWSARDEVAFAGVMVRQVTSIVTENDESNVAMLAVNTRLGYRPLATELSWVKHL